VGGGGGTPKKPKNPNPMLLAIAEYSGSTGERRGRVFLGQYPLTSKATLPCLEREKSLNTLKHQFNIHTFAAKQAASAMGQAQVRDHPSDTCAVTIFAKALTLSS